MTFIFLAMLPIFFWDFSIPHPLWKTVAIIANAFIWGMMFGLKPIIHKVAQQELERIRRENDL